MGLRKKLSYLNLFRRAKETWDLNLPSQLVNYIEEEAKKNKEINQSELMRRVAGNYSGKSEVPDIQDFKDPLVLVKENDKIGRFGNSKEHKILGKNMAKGGIGGGILGFLTGNPQEGVMIGSLLGGDCTNQVYL